MLGGREAEHVQAANLKVQECDKRRGRGAENEPLKAAH